jgi:electron transfer flavoprotein alpha subunit
MILVYVEHDAGRPDRLSAEALTFARRIAGDLGDPLHAVVVGAGPAPAGLAAALAEYGVARVHAVEHPGLAAHAPEAIGASLAQLVAATTPVAVIGPGSDRGTEAMAHLAARTGLPLAANCTDAKPGPNPGTGWEVTRQRWGGSLLEDLVLDAPTVLLTVAGHALEPSTVPAADPGAQPAATVESFSPVLTDRDLRARVVSHVAAESGAVSLADARVVVGGGRGVGSAEGFADLDELARLLGGAVGVSRVVTSAGWRPHVQQVGQTGTRIAPELYIACGISGAIQHIVGCRSAKVILAINKDRDAPLVARAQYAIIGDLHAVLPAIVAEVRSATGR